MRGPLETARKSPIAGQRVARTASRNAFFRDPERGLTLGWGGAAPWTGDLVVDRAEWLVKGGSCGSCPLTVARRCGSPYQYALYAGGWLCGASAWLCC